MLCQPWREPKETETSLRETLKNRVEPPRVLRRLVGFNYAAFKHFC
jgi:hypothetical protein